MSCIGISIASNTALHQASVCIQSLFLILILYVFNSSLFVFFLHVNHVVHVKLYAKHQYADIPCFLSLFVLFSCELCDSGEAVHQ